MEAVRLHRPEAERRSVTRALRVALIGSVALAAVLLSLLAVASGNNELLQRHYGLLLWLNVAIAILLAILAVELARRLLIRYRRGLFGTRLMARLAMAFIMMTTVPVLLIYIVAVQFLGRSIESWFDVPMERALESGLTLGRASIDSMLNDLLARTRSGAVSLELMPASGWAERLDELREQLGVQEALILSGSGQILNASGTRFASLLPDLPSSAALRQLRVGRSYSAIEALATPVIESLGTDPQAEGRVGLEPPVSDLAVGGAQRLPEGHRDRASHSAGLKMRALVTIGTSTLGEDSRILQFVQPVPTNLAETAEAVQSGFQDYQELSLSRAGLKRIFRVTLTVTVLLTVFSAIAAAFLLAGWMTGPLSMLAAGTRAVAEGDFRPVKDYIGRDELGVLTQSFNAMTRQLEDARAQVERNRMGLEQANARLASLLSNLTAGVIVLDRDYKLTLANAGAEKMLGTPTARLAGLHVSQLPGFAPYADRLIEAYEALDEETTREEAPAWQQQVVIDAKTSDNSEQGGGKTLLLRGAVLPEAQGDHLLVLDDVTDVVSAQRSLAWREVARRLAHEIKNPLTPIQLAAERMGLKLADKLSGADREMLAKNTRTIVNQVGALNVMVDEFRDYARMPSARLEPLELNDVVAEVLAMYADTDPTRVVRTHLTPGLPKILGDAGQQRQVGHNLLKNASEATEKQPQRLIEVYTDATHNNSRQLTGVRLVVRDDGPGFGVGLIARAFEPYVTNKAKGTGLGL
ncbi:MAG: HAMP domain-containing protein, partial [Burkholderiaceae bacterium]